MQLHRNSNAPFDYRAYLESAEWKEKRDLVMWRCHNICQGCLSARAEQVHHLTYEDIGQEFLWQLVALCESCHRRYHQRRGNKP